MDLKLIELLVMKKLFKLMLVFFILQMIMVAGVYLLFAYHSAGFENDLLWRLGLETAPNVMCYPQLVP